MGRRPKSKSGTATNRDSDKLIVRLPEGMRAQIAALAETNGRSMTAEVVAAIEQHLKGPGRIDAIEAFIGKYRASIEKMDNLVDWLDHDLPKEVERLRSDVDAIDPRPDYRE